MSKFNKRTVALAVAAALTMPTAAMAASAGYADEVSYTYASNLFGAADGTITSPAGFTLSTQAADNIIGRTTGFGVRLILQDGVTFGEGLDAPAPGAALTGYTVQGPVNAAQQSVAVFSVTPDPEATEQDIGIGSLLVWDGIPLANLDGLEDGGSASVVVELFDSNTAQVILRTTASVLVDTVEGTTISFDASAGDVASRINVSPCGEAGPNTSFSENGVVGECNSLTFNAGAVTFGITQVDGEPVLALGSGGANEVDGEFVFAEGDTFEVSVEGTDLSPFSAILASDDDCTTEEAEGEIDGQTITFSSGAFSPTGGTGYVCLIADGETQIQAQALSAIASIDFADEDVIDPASETGTLLPLRYNGTVLEFQNVNPASNPRAESFVRFTNNSSVDCPVTLVGRDDSGMAGDSSVAFTLAPGASQTLNSNDLENGSSKATGAFGDGAGRWYVTANAECVNFVGSALNRNLEDGTVTNLTSDKRVTNQDRYFEYFFNQPN
ncbi:hypothetical protein [Coralloluteibacterium stylophorae]|uniref:Choice-of-anchor D domain-containing protein n=1 Tax=Coralloluteibacterium stylophorae TaxID=1776034 RepID=A0A8J7VU50_9GAMM|nr:hypothetical protein [Coralloluteibacterium stylophorae]MBS7457832.1 hypothetical protein [Coralloluteibacterium stylophorae]